MPVAIGGLSWASTAQHSKENSKVEVVGRDGNTYAHGARDNIQKKIARFYPETCLVQTVFYPLGLQHSKENSKTAVFLPSNSTMYSLSPAHMTTFKRK